MKRPQTSRATRTAVPSWLTGKVDTASLAALVERLATQIDVTTIDQFWLFPMRRVAGVESTVFVLSIQELEDRRRVITAHVRATRNKRGEPAIDLKLDEHALAPAELIPRIIEGVLRRLSDDFASTPPSTAHIDGSVDRWVALVDALAGVRPNEPLPDVLIPDARPDAEPERADDNEEDGLDD